MIQRQGKVCGYRYITEQFESIDEFLTTLESRPISEAYKRDSCARNVRSESISDARWSGAKSYQQAREQFVLGTKAKKELQKVYSQMMVSRERETVVSVCGGAPIVANALRGLPNSMIDVRRKRTPRTVRVVVNMSIPCHASAADITEAGKKIIAAVGKLDAQGIQTEIICGADRLLSGSQILSCGITIKNAGQAFNAARVSFSMSSPAFLRVFQFAHCSSHPQAVYDSGYGRTIKNVLYDDAELTKYYQTVYGQGIYFTLADVARRGDASIEDAIRAWQKAPI